MQGGSRQRGSGRGSRGLHRLLALVALSLVLLPSGSAGADRQGRPDRPLHLLAMGGYYGSLGGPAGTGAVSYGPSVALEVLPGGFARRYGLRAELRGFEGTDHGMALLGAVYEAGAARPQVVLSFVGNLGLTDSKAPVVGAGIEGSLRLYGPLGLTSLLDLHLIVDGADTRPALAWTLSLNLGF